MKIRAVVMGVVSASMLGCFSSNYAMGGFEQQEAMMRKALEKMSKEQVRNIANEQFAGPMNAIASEVMAGVRWIGLNGVLLVLLGEGVSDSLYKKAGMVLTGLMAASEVVTLVKNVNSLRLLIAEQEKVYRQLMSMRAGSAAQGVDTSTDDAEEEDDQA